MAVQLLFTHNIPDVDECLNTPCDQLCTNTDGSFQCSCFGGYDLQDNGYTCEGHNTTVPHTTKMNCIIIVDLCGKN